VKIIADKMLQLSYFFIKFDNFSVSATVYHLNNPITKQCTALNKTLLLRSPVVPRCYLIHDLVIKTRETL